MDARRAAGGLALSLSLSCLAMSTAEAQTAPDAAATYIQTYARETSFSGIVLVSRDGRTLYQETFGEAERAFHTPIEASTRFPIASVTKLFVSALTLQLVDEGRLALDQSIGAYMSDLPNAAASGITLRQLLNHTSGLAQFDRVASHQEAFENGIPAYQRPMSLDGALELCCSAPLEHEPGSAFAYNNADYFVVQRILERVTGKSLADLLRERMLDPLDMKDTGLLDWRSINPRLATTYFTAPDTHGLQSDMPVYWENWRAAGAMYSTVADLNRFADALFAGQLISVAAREELLRPGLDDYGLGLWSYTFRRHGRTHRVAKRPGSIMGANAVLYRLRDQSLNIIILANSNASDLDVFAQRLAEQWISQTR